MIYLEKKCLPVITLPEAAEEINLWELNSALRRHPSDLIYFEYRLRLYGLVSLGDILRACKAGRNTVKLNTSFTCVKKNDYIPARQIFLNNSRIHAIPATDEDGTLLGAFSRYDDLLFLKSWNGWDRCRFIESFAAKYQRIALVRPVDPMPECARQFELWFEKLSSKGFLCRRITLDEVPDAYENGSVVLFTDEDQRRGARAVLTIEGRTYRNDEYTMTYLDMTRAMCEPPAEELLKDLQKHGVHVLQLSAERRDSDYQERLYRKFKTRAERFGRGMAYVHPEEAQAFYGPLYSEEYAQAVGKHMFLMDQQHSFTRLRDCDEPYFHISGGERLTTDQPEHADASIFFFGPCVAVGPYVEDGHTIESFLQQMLNDEGYLYRVVNCGCWESHYSELLRIASTPMKKGDIAVFFYEEQPFASTDSLDLLHLLEENDVPAEWLLDSPVHCNDRVHKLYAQAIFDRLKESALEKKPAAGEESRLQRTRTLFPSVDAMRFLYLDRYYWDLPPASGDRIAYIGIHGNPFTNGHLYLAKKALERSDRLFVTVIEEELGLFSFVERYAMACAALKDLGDVIVAPAGPFQGTRATFPEYFTKSETSSEENLMNDLRIFATLIAPGLGVTARYFGEESRNPTMVAFNRFAADILHESGIDTIEIPRAKIDGRPISASDVRELDPDQLETLRSSVPPTTLDIMLCRAL